jgi:hypothetical protein
MNLVNAHPNILEEIEKWKRNSMVNDFASISLHGVKGTVLLAIFLFACLIVYHRPKQVRRQRDGP